MTERGIFRLPGDEGGTGKRKRSGSGTADRSEEFLAGTTIISVVESRAREVCIAKLDTSNSFEIGLYIHLDGHSYNETILEITNIRPNEILLHDGCRDRILSKKIENEFNKACTINYISRQYFDQDYGTQMLKKVVAGKVDSDLLAKYIVVAGVYCLLKYVENCRASPFPSGSIRIMFERGNSERMLIDRRTALNLELVANIRSGDQKESLFGVINHTKTSVGARLLRSNILCPLTGVASILARQDLVDYLLHNSDIYSGVVNLIHQLPDIDKMLSGLTHKPKTLTTNTLRQGIDTLIYVKQAIKVLEEVVQVAVDGKENVDMNSGDVRHLPVVLQGAAANFRDIRLGKISKAISNVLSEGSSYSKSAHEMRYHECFAVKTGVDGYLDVSRKTYLETVEEIFARAEELSAQHGFTVKAHYSTNRGYFLMIPADVDPLPPLFIQPLQQKKWIHCSTLEINSLSARAEESINESLKMSNDIIQTWLERVRNDIEALFRMADSVALLDICISFADLVALSPLQYSRPELKTRGPLAIKAAKHPIICELSGGKQVHDFKPTDTLLAEVQSLVIVTGPNGSGKTVYIKQVALITILAQIGCYVPCSFASISIRDRILSRLGTNDDMENNMSTFMMEMKETSYLIDHVSPSSLVLIDELGRGTATIDGISIAFAVAEELMRARAFTLFVTHFPQLTEIPKLYSLARNVHMKTVIRFEQDQSPAPVSSRQQTARSLQSLVSVDFVREVTPGSCEFQNGYGITMSELCGFPEAVVADARELRKRLADMYPLMIDPEAQGGAKFALFRLLQDLLAVKDGCVSEEMFAEKIDRYRSSISPEALHELRVALEELLSG